MSSQYQSKRDSNERLEKVELELVDPSTCWVAEMSRSSSLILRYSAGQDNLNGLLHAELGDADDIKSLFSAEINWLLGYSYSPPKPGLGLRLWSSQKCNCL